MIRTNHDFIIYIDKLRKKGSYEIDEQVFAPKTMILKQDRRYSSVYLIREGIAKCYITDENGKEFIQEFLGQGMEFGELEIFSNKLTICSVTSVSELKVYSFPHSTYRALLKEDPTFNGLVMKALADKIRYKAPRHSYQHSYPIEDNILRLQKLFPELTEVLPKKDIANYIGVTTRSLNRALKELKQKQDNPK
ncbi:Crp/Fnr family transcriptional regulator [Flagellimonas meridianipacifica]|uniref:CRP-like cAMP-binding protein n=1 Tax=Flagellimonas meridianipacifica TaxID=1080225 RepID=A0A2T0MBF7_9FLAO|nr:Crp/Fnr family transcriptional regulator [Allomuricauda pacifica]PRX54827.1 CRP-like cAMP-binding protein [Allomuricauda pacifica]